MIPLEFLVAGRVQRVTEKQRQHAEHLVAVVEDEGASLRLLVPQVRPAAGEVLAELSFRQAIPVLYIVNGMECAERSSYQGFAKYG